MSLPQEDFGAICKGNVIFSTLSHMYVSINIIPHLPLPFPHHSPL